MFSIELVWETLQQVLSEVFNEYIDYNNTAELMFSNPAEYADRPSLIDFSQYLSKKGAVVTRSQPVPPLFQFSQSAQFNTMTSYLQEHNRFLVKQETSKAPVSAYKQYVCKSNYRNITVVHDVLRRIIDDIDTSYEFHPSKRILDR